MLSIIDHNNIDYIAYSIIHSLIVDALCHYRVTIIINVDLSLCIFYLSLHFSCIIYKYRVILITLLVNSSVINVYT